MRGWLKLRKEQGVEAGARAYKAKCRTRVNKHEFWARVIHTQGPRPVAQPELPGRGEP